MIHQGIEVDYINSIFVKFHHDCVDIDLVPKYINQVQRHKAFYNRTCNLQFFLFFHSFISFLQELDKQINQKYPTKAHLYYSQVKTNNEDLDYSNHKIFHWQMLLLYSKSPKYQYFGH